ncbi:hypothetical protein QR680_018144 [Steinernema hermaphroditum]|uniref:G-protein coupled receptors family 1 profile domain-containing protein n=1 Tax=Steinernema hermaphroditum TaxID=289476 RepID=A0AA39HH07_9BILA|nr:hypothetical protein QR680_018144 [Steinernema hermaphroditum]
MVSEGVEMVIYVVEGLIVMAANLPVALTIFFLKKFRNSKEFTFIGGLCLADVVYGLCYVCAGISRLHMYSTGEDKLLRTRVECYWAPWVVLSFAGYQGTAVLTLLVAFDRLIAVFVPVWYVKFSRTKRIVVMCATFLFVVATIPVAFVFEMKSPDGQGLVSAECYFSKSLIAPLWNFVLSFRVFAVLLSVIFYIPIGYRVRKLVNDNKKRSVLKNTHLIHLTATIALTTTVSLVLIVVPDIFFLFNFGNIGSDYHLVFYLISLNNCVVNLLLYSFRHKELRSAVASGIRMVLRREMSTQTRHVAVVRDVPTRTLNMLS